jgi:hypothetical protein
MDDRYRLTRLILNGQRVRDFLTYQVFSFVKDHWPGAPKRTGACRSDALQRARAGPGAGEPRLMSVDPVSGAHREVPRQVYEIERHDLSEVPAWA